MRLRTTLLASSLLVATSMHVAQAQENEPNVKYSWMLPKTVIEATITYTFAGCQDNAGDEFGPGANLSLKIVPTLVAKVIPDTHVGRLAFRPAQETQSFWEDRNINIKTFPGSHILSSIGSSPASQAGQITTNVLTGLTKIVAVAFGVPSVPFSATALPVPPPTASKCGKAQQLKQKIEDLKTEIAALQETLSGGVEESMQKKVKSQIDAKQALITTRQSELDDMSTVVIKRVIDPGFTTVEADPNGAEPELLSKSDLPESRPVDASGLVAKFKPTTKQLKKAGWYEDESKISAREAGRLEVNVYMNFDQAVLAVRKQSGKYVQTPVSEDDGEIFRDVAYIPVVVWRGQRTGQTATGPLDPVQLTPAQMMAFGQYGRAQILPFKVDTFKSLGWSMTFQENGEVTDAQFSNKAWGVAATGAFAAAAGAANSIATEQRNASSASLQASALQGQADLIYQRQRLQQCESNPANCSKN